MLKSAKQAVLRIAKQGGTFDVMMRSGFRSDRLLVLAYHGVAIDDENEWNSSLYVTERFLRRRFQILKDSECTVLPLGEAIARLYAGTLPKRAVTLTFDDGGFSFYKKAWPLISEFGFPATVYLTTFYSLFNRPVFPVAVDYLLWKARDREMDLTKLLGEGWEADRREVPDRRSLQRQIVAWASEQQLSAREKDHLLAQLADLLSIDYQEFCDGRSMSLMNPNEVASISDAGTDIQLHTHRHRVPHSRELFLKEISENSEIITSITGKRPAHLCYPSGEYFRTLFPWLREAGVRSATTCETALAEISTEPYLIPRLVDTLHLSEVEFEGWLSGVSHFPPQRAPALAGKYS